MLKGSLRETLYDWPDRNATNRGRVSPLEVRKKTVYQENQVAYMSDDVRPSTVPRQGG